MLHRSLTLRRCETLLGLRRVGGAYLGASGAACRCGTCHSSGACRCCGAICCGRAPCAGDAYCADCRSTHGGRSFRGARSEGRVGCCSTRSRADMPGLAGVPRLSGAVRSSNPRAALPGAGARRTGAAGRLGRRRASADMVSGRPPLARMAACSLAKETGARAGASRATTGRSMSARGGVLITRPESRPRTLCRTGMMAGAAVLARTPTPPRWVRITRCGATGCAEVNTLRGTAVTAPGTSLLPYRMLPACPLYALLIAVSVIRVFAMLMLRTYAGLA